MINRDGTCELLQSWADEAWAEDGQLVWKIHLSLNRETNTYTMALVHRMASGQGDIYRQVVVDALTLESAPLESSIGLLIDYLQNMRVDIIELLDQQLANGLKLVETHYWKQSYAQVSISGIDLLRGYVA